MCLVAVIRVDSDGPAKVLEAVQKVHNLIPVIAVGRLDLPEMAEMVIAEGKADLVAIGRGLLSDPFWVKKIEQGRQKHIRPCLGCHDGSAPAFRKA